MSAPLWGLIALGVKLEDGGPVFYTQERVGKGGSRFKGWKFRSMVPDSGRRFGPLQASNGDPRVTRIGRFLRATALDELPQLWNIFRGDMSFVGPRALLPEEIEVNGGGELIPLDEISGCERRHGVRPGLIGLAQVYAPRNIPRQHKFKYDHLYIRKQSFCLDVKLIVLSFWITEDAVASQDCVCLAVAHTTFDHAMAWLIKHSRLLIDATGATRFLDDDQSPASWPAHVPMKV